MLDMGLKTTELNVYAYIYSFTKGAKGLFYGSQASIAKAIGVSLRTVNRIISKLYKRELIEKVEIDGYTGIRCYTSPLVEPKAPPTTRENYAGDYSREELLYMFDGRMYDFFPKPKFEFVMLCNDNVSMSIEQLATLATMVAPEVLKVYLKRLEHIVKKSLEEGTRGPRNHYQIIKKWIKEDNAV
jgi:predicted DNA-binding transcriptional regulator